MPDPLTRLPPPAIREALRKAAGRPPEKAKHTVSSFVVSDRRPELGWVTMADPEGNEFCVEKSLAERAADEET